MRTYYTVATCDRCKEVQEPYAGFDRAMPTVEVTEETQPNADGWKPSPMRRELDLCQSCRFSFERWLHYKGGELT